MTVFDGIGLGAVIAAAIDGRKVAFTGDNVFTDLAPGMDGGLTNQLFQTTVLRNSYQLWMHQKCADVMDLVAPDLVCPGHRQLIPWDDSKSLEYRDYINRGERVVRRLTGESTGQSVDLFWARLRPYLLEVPPGAEATYTLMLRNNFDADTRFEARLLAQKDRELLEIATLHELYPALFEKSLHLTALGTTGIVK